jgi:CRISPR-associated protein Cmr4
LAARKVFGFAGRKKKKDSGEEEDISQAAELTLTDARVLFLPVRSYAGTFAFITCPLVLERLNRDLKALGLPGLQSPIPTPQQTEALLAQETEIVHNGQVILEDIDLTAQREGAEALIQELGQMVFDPEAAYFQRRFALVSNDVFSYFCEMGLEIIARVQLNPAQKTVEEGPWYEEAIPAETVFSCFAIGKSGFEELNRPYLQLGGQASVGRGLLRRLGGSQ